MARALSFVALAALSLSALLACKGGSGGLGESGQQLITQKNGQPTGDGKTCSWSGTEQLDHAADKSDATGSHLVGATFKSLDGCNDCSCTADGISCTTLTCDAGTSSGGTSSGGTSSGGQACSTEAKVCPDGSSVGRTGPNCEFAPCPSVDCTTLSQNAMSVVSQAIDAHKTCTTVDDCVEISLSASCFDACSRAMNKAETSFLQAAQDQVDANQCKQFATQGCKKIVPPCVPPGQLQCVSNVCTLQ